MLALVPEWAHYYGEFWKAIRSRNLWFIRLRYFAVIILFVFLLTGEYLLSFQLSSTQIRSFIVIAVGILIYNIIIHRTREYASCDPDKFNCLHISLIQMVLDLCALMILVYYTGVIDSPLYMLFIFHMIIGSLILPGYIIYSIAALISITFTALTFLERYDLINHYLIKGIYAGERIHNIQYDVLFTLIFTFMLFFSVFIANKITRQLYKREQQIRSTLEKLNESEIAKQKYTIGVVHEIKSPITAVHTILGMIQNKYYGPINAEIEKRILRAMDRTNESLNLINNILRISKLKLLEIKATEEINVKEFILKIIDGFGEVIKSKEIQVILNDERSNSRTLKSDKILLELAISNLINNSIKYVNESGAIKIVLTNNENELILEISDDGIGIPANELSRIFEQFYRATNIDKSLKEGSGMGLAIVKEIVERLEGSINVESPSKISKPGAPGSTFIISLPYKLKNKPYDIFEVNDQDYLSSKSSD